jgi:hypothetical protein
MHRHLLFSWQPRRLPCRTPSSLCRKAFPTPLMFGISRAARSASLCMFCYISQRENNSEDDNDRSVPVLPANQHGEAWGLDSGVEYDTTQKWHHETCSMFRNLPTSQLLLPLRYSSSRSCMLRQPNVNPGPSEKVTSRLPQPGLHATPGDTGIDNVTVRGVASPHYHHHRSIFITSFPFPGRRRK